MIKELKEYKEIFESEAKEILEKCEKIVLKIEKEGFKKEFLDELFRHFHTLKGSSASIGEFEIEKISHELEDKLDEIRKGKKEYLDVEELFKKIDEIKKLIEKKEEGEIYEIEIYLSSETPLKNVRAFVIIKEISKKSKIIETYPDIESIKQDKFDFSFKLKIKGNKEEVEEILNLFSDIEYYKILPLKKEEKEIIEKKEEIFEIKVKSENIDRIINYMGELVIEKDKLKNIIYEKKDKEIIESFDHFERILNSLSDLTINLRLVPAKIIFGTIPRYVRDEAKKLNKEVEIEIIGEEIEIDRIILEKLKEPILHIIRNSIDHGIEEPEERIRIGKKRSGKIILEIKKDKGIVFIKIKDDGRGNN
jgi:two-component system chemotaxis sensor kinase CheA